jgi:hypothetical protein
VISRGALPMCSSACHVDPQSARGQMIKYLISCALCFDPRADWGSTLGAYSPTRSALPAMRKSLKIVPGQFAERQALRPGRNRWVRWDSIWWRVQIRVERRMPAFRNGQDRLDAGDPGRGTQRHESWSFGSRPLGSNTRIWCGGSSLHRQRTRL